MAALAQKRAEARTRYYVREEAGRIGWNVRHPSRGGNFLEEQEIVDYFPELKFALKNDRPDFAAVVNGTLRLVLECKNDWCDADKALTKAEEYADTINRLAGYDARVAVGVAGTPDKRVQIRCTFKRGRRWVVLSSHDWPLTQIPTPAELETAFENNDGTTDVQVPNERQFFTAAISISRLLRLAKIVEADRPKVIGAIVLALYHSDFPLEPDLVIEHINTNVRAATNTFSDIPNDRRQSLVETLVLSTEAHRLRPKIGDIVHQLERLNVRSIMRSGVDFLGQFYETFLRYGMGSKGLGIVFTPRHITRFCAELLEVQIGQTVYDPACGTGGFLVAAFDRMMKGATTTAARRKSKESLFGYDTNSTVWALAVLNMFFRGDGKSHIIWDDCFRHQEEHVESFDVALLNPPFSQEGEPETDFIDSALKSVRPGGRVAVVVKTSVMVDSGSVLRKWRKALAADHHIEGVVTLPSDLFYPAGVPTVVLIVKAHMPDKNRATFVARIENDGFEVSKKRRIPIEGSQLPQMIELFRKYERMGHVDVIPNLAMVIDRQQIIDGEEVCAERWLPSGSFDETVYEHHRTNALRQISLAIANHPDIADEMLANYEEHLASGRKEGRPTYRAVLSDWFVIRNGKSTGRKNYRAGMVPYISSGDTYNGVVAFVEPPDEEIYTEPHISVSALGQAYIQPWRFCARGNGASAVRILKPRFSMTVAELFWFVGHINAQRWRFHFGRTAIPDRLSRLEVDPPPTDLAEFPPLEEKLMTFKQGLDLLMDVGGELLAEEIEDKRDAEIARLRLTEIKQTPDRLIQGDELRERLARLET